ncbi:MAG: UDP-N-acetylmuramoyl-L-alanine--D-glutamate ligase [Bacteroidetes bacterium]|nr:UDP-N-acetylmuramoyl-L-alanine--D-glutamate ligase [Bacteroidota bacterium]
MDINLLKKKKVTVIGAARSGAAAAKLLRVNGAEVFVSDSSPAEKLQPSISWLNSESIEYETGKHSARVYECEIMVISPGVPSNAPVVLEAVKRDIKVFSELEIGSWFCRSPIVAVTGANGKTTTTTLIGRILDHAKKKHVVAGNIGTAFSSVVLELVETDIVVLEVSSFQLDHIDMFRPKISILLNITPDHMDRYDHSMEKYAASKARVFRNQQSEDILIYNADDEWTNRIITQAKCRKIAFSADKKTDEGAFVENEKLAVVLGGVKTEIIDIAGIFIKGKHNLYNSMAAVLAGQLLGVEAGFIRSTLEKFEGVEHRLEFVRSAGNVCYYNDSKATNVDSVWYALQAFKEPIVLLLGGRDKGNDYSQLTEVVRKKVKAIVAIGESAEKVEQAFRGVVGIKRADTMDEAVAAAHSLAESGDIVLLSPACASFDWFKNYEHRGQVFKELVKNL